jgi:acetolactate synthase-1/2/3 large subunit
VIQVDVDASQLNLNYGINQGLLSDVGTAIDALVGGLEERKPWYDRKPERHPPQNDPARGISAAKIIHALNAQSPEDAIVSADIGNHRLWVCEQLDVTRPEGLLQSCEFDAMGFSLPAAIGASVALPGTKVIAIAGDGGFVHTLGELAVAQELRLPIVAIIFVDGALGILRHQAEEMYGEDHFVRLAPIDFATVAEGFGVEARTVDEDAEVDDAIEWAMKAVKPVLLSITIDPNEIFPPLRTKIEQRQRDLLGEVPA